MELIEPFIIDANIFMEAARRYYAFDIAKPFWEGLINYANQGILFSIDKVYDEIMEGNDLLKDWAESEFKDFFHKSETTPIFSIFESQDDTYTKKHFGILSNFYMVNPNVHSYTLPVADTTIVLDSSGIVMDTTIKWADTLYKRVEDLPPLPKGYVPIKTMKQRFDSAVQNK